MSIPRASRRPTATHDIDRSKLDLEGVPLKTTLRLMLKQLGLAYCVRDGVLIISSVQGIIDELEEAQQELETTDGDRSGGPRGGAMTAGIRPRASADDA